MSTFRIASSIGIGFGSVVFGFIATFAYFVPKSFPDADQWPLYFLGKVSEVDSGKGEGTQVREPVRSFTQIDVESLYPPTPLDVPMWVPLPGMTAADRVKVHRLIEPETPSVIRRFPLSELTDPKCFRLTTDGERLFIYRSSKIEVWETNSATVESLIDVSIKAPIGLIERLDQSEIGIYNDKELIIYSTRDKRLLSRMELPSVKLLNRAAEADVYFGVKENGELFLLDLDRRSIVMFAGPKTLRHRIAVSPNGKAVLSTSSIGLVKWSGFETRKIEFIERPSVDVDVKTQIPAAGNDMEAWGSVHGVHVYRDDVFASVWKGEKFPFYWNVAQERVFVAKEPSGYEWLVVLGSHIDRQSKTRKSVFDFKISDQSIMASGPLKLDSERIDKIEMSLDSKTVVYLDEHGITLLKRMEWSDPCASQFLEYAKGLIYEGRFELFEAIAEDLRRRNFPEHLLTGEELYARMVERAGRVACYISSSPDNPACKKIAGPLAVWLNSRSDMASMVSIAIHVQLAWESRGKGYASEVTEKGFQDFEAHMTAALPYLEEFIHRDDAPRIAYQNYLGLPRSVLDGDETSTRIYFEGMRRFPHDFNFHLHAMIQCLPRWYGEAGMADQHIRALAESYPDKFNEQIYTLLALELLGVHGESMFDPQEANLDRKRIYRSIPKLVESSALNWTNTEVLLKIALKDGRTKEAELLAGYHLESFSFPGRRTYKDPVLCFLMRRKDERCEKLGLIERN